MRNIALRYYHHLPGKVDPSSDADGETHHGSNVLVHLGLANWNELHQEQGLKSSGVGAGSLTESIASRGMSPWVMNERTTPLGMKNQCCLAAQLSLQEW
jgi:hypothetical protein